MCEWGDGDSEATRDREHIIVQREVLAHLSVVDDVEAVRQGGVHLVQGGGAVLVSAVLRLKQRHGVGECVGD